MIPDPMIPETRYTSSGDEINDACASRLTKALVAPRISYRPGAYDPEFRRHAHPKKSVNRREAFLCLP